MTPQGEKRTETGVRSPSEGRDIPTQPDLPDPAQRKAGAVPRRLEGCDKLAAGVEPAKNRIILLALSLGLTVLVLEGAIRILDPPLLREDPRLQLVSAPLVEHGDGSVRYPTQSKVRTVLLSSKGIEFDVRFRTNDLGLIDHRDYVPDPGHAQAGSGRRFAFVGDSFTAGVEGGEPWVPALRDRLGLEIYNLGVPATGITQFRRLLAALQGQLRFTDILVLALSDDFFRPPWHPLVEGTQIRICPEGEEVEACRGRRPIAHLFDPGLSRDEVLALGQRLRQADRLAGPGMGLPRVLRQSRLLTLVQRLSGRLARRRLRGEAFERNLEALAGIRSDLPGARLLLVHLAGKRETLRRRHDLDLRSRVEALGIRYVSTLEDCPLQAGDFLEHDNHPNARGYAALARCIAGYLGAAGSRAAQQRP